jgi:hypothetical protein
MTSGVDGKIFIYNEKIGVNFSETFYLIKGNKINF